MLCRVILLHVRSHSWLCGDRSQAPASQYLSCPILRLLDNLAHVPAVEIDSARATSGGCCGFCFCCARTKKPRGWRSLAGHHTPNSSLGLLVVARQRGG